MRFRLGYLAATIVVAAVDGAFLGGVAAIVSALSTLVLGVLAHRKGTSEGRVAAGAEKAKAEAELAAWQLIAEEREQARRELLELLRPDEGDTDDGRDRRSDRPSPDGEGAPEALAHDRRRGDPARSRRARARRSGSQ